ncbi:hypothetical protein ON010_g4827 [Phytophthora cinnamomi]|nr:hypothetical protein ON010_g4827 [Phytophthora cinnamomi]
MPTTFAGGHGVNTQDLDIPKRLSFVSGTSQPKDIEEGGYAGVKTPEHVPIGALPPGGEDGAIRSQVTAASQLVVLPWSFKVFYGILFDCRPIFGYRRRPYMMIGWAVCFIMLLVMAIMPIGKPYFTDAADRSVDPSDYTPDLEARINYDAPSEGAKYVMLMFFAAVGYVMADVSADSITVELAQREPLEKRGKMQSCIYTVRTAMVIVGEFLTGFFFNGEDYGGTFNFSLSFPQLMIVVAVLMLPVFPTTWFYIKEEKTEAANFKDHRSTSRSPAPCCEQLKSPDRAFCVGSSPSRADPDHSRSRKHSSNKSHGGRGSERGGGGDQAAQEQAGLLVLHPHEQRRHRGQVREPRVQGGHHARLPRAEPLRAYQEAPAEALPGPERQRDRMAASADQDARDDHRPALEVHARGAAAGRGDGHDAGADWPRRRRGGGSQRGEGGGEARGGDMITRCAEQSDGRTC